MVEHQLRPLFAFFNALTIPTAVYAEDAAFTGSGLTDPTVVRRVEMAAEQVAEIMGPAECRPRRRANVRT